MPKITRWKCRDCGKVVLEGDSLEFSTDYYGIEKVRRKLWFLWGSYDAICKDCLSLVCANCGHGRPDHQDDWGGCILCCDLCKFEATRLQLHIRCGTCGTLHITHLPPGSPYIATKDALTNDCHICLPLKK